ncbi:MAG: spore coat protein U domain-containing protein [Proteobacteria bacterium]|nr:spore coat protein U domain-containing protein [Pseudomonadota bacterium]
MLFNLLKSFLICLFAVLSVPAFASCIGLNCTCSVASQPLVFGNYHVQNGTQTTTTGNVQVTCSALVAGLNVSYNIKLNSGSSGNFSARTLKSGANNLNYNLYTSATYAQVWGDGSGSTVIVSDAYILSLLSVTRNYTVYGKIPALQNVAVGAYSDTITVTVEY